MRKMKLDIEQLQVETFAVTRDGTGAGGTVFGRATDTSPEDKDLPSFYCGGGGSAATGPSNPVCIGPTFCCNPTANTGCCPPQTLPETCPWSCNGTCAGTCGVSCPAYMCSL